MAAAPLCPSCSAELSGDRCRRCGAVARAGSYRVLSVLAETPHGRTYRAEGPAGAVALKELVFALVPNAQQLDAFEREATLLGSVSHPQVPRMIESFREGEGPALRLYLAQELVEGEPLSHRIGIDEAQARDIARQMLGVLRYLHERGIVHRDVKPANILRRSDGTLALVDFGAARVLEGVTHDATVVGTFGYMPPEQLGGTVDATSDLYALGATLVHLVGRKAPEDLLGPDLELRLGHLNVAPAFRAFLTRLTARHRASRPATTAEALRLLDSPPRPVVRTRVVVAVVFGIVAAAWLVAQSAASSSRAAAERAHRARIEAFERELNAPVAKPPPAQAPSTPDHRDLSLGRLLSGEKLREIDPDLPPCYEHAGIELARVRIWPEQNALQLKLVLHSQDRSCDWSPLSVVAFTADGEALPARGAHGDAPRDGWRDAFYDFALPPGATAVRLEVSGPSRAIEAWRLGLDESGIKRVGYALAGTVDVSRATVQVPVSTGCARLTNGTLQMFWIDDTVPGRRELRARAVFRRRNDTAHPCARPAHLMVAGVRGAYDSSAALDSDRTAKLTLSLRQRGDRLRVALGEADRTFAVLRVDLQRATVEQEALAATEP